MATKRNTLIKEVKRVFENAKGVGGTQWKKVLRTRIDGNEFQGSNVLVILEQAETYLDVVSPDKRDRTLELELISRTYVPKGQVAGDVAHEVLADMEDIVEANERWDGAAIATFLQSNIIDIENEGDRVCEITLFISVRYRTRRSDPRT